MENLPSRPLPRKEPCNADNHQAPLPEKTFEADLPDLSCEVCELQNIRVFFCVYCDGHFCSNCWARERAHKPGKLGPDGLPHEKADTEVVSRLKATFNPPSDPGIQERMHLEDEDTTWFGISRDATGRPIFQDYGRYSTLIANGASSEHRTRFPRLVSFIGQTGAGKSTLVKMLIERQSYGIDDPEKRRLFQCPIVGSSTNDSVPTSGDVHLYADPSTYFTTFPTLYADCEGLEGGENIPIGARRQDTEGGIVRRRDDHNQEVNRSKKRWRISRGQERPIAWADSPAKQKRQYGVTEFYPRLLYTFSDVVVFVLQNPKYLTLPPCSLPILLMLVSERLNRLF
jgi:energy-coupling factor transporter ATP-binding protein EcfA2